VVSIKLRRSRAFTLIELLAVVSILSLLAAILQRALFGAKRSSLKSSCQANLHQIGTSFHLYAIDWDDRFPWAIDQFIRANREARTEYPSPIDEIPDMVGTLSTYTGGRGNLWRCPSDRTEFQAPVLDQVQTKTYPSAYDFAGTSYIFLLAKKYIGQSQTSLNLTELRLCSDAGLWHCLYSNPNVLTPKENVLFGDGHVRFASMMDKS
jgi:prepilin-type N-terminal cleavage/methylation domain-containing protein